MRVSTLKSDTGYSPLLNPHIQVSLNGCFLSVITADEELGEVLVYRKDGYGNYLKGPDDEVLTEVLKGTVLIDMVTDGTKH